MTANTLTIMGSTFLNDCMAFMEAKTRDIHFLGKT